MKTDPSGWNAIDKRKGINISPRISIIHKQSLFHTAKKRPLHAAVFAFAEIVFLLRPVTEKNNSHFFIAIFLIFLPAALGRRR